MRLPLVLLLMVGSNFALAPDPSVLTIAGLAGTLSAAIIGIMFMYSRLTQDAQIEAQARENLRELISGGLVVFIVYLFVFGSLDLLPILTGQADVGSVAISKIDSYTDELVKDYEMTIKVTSRIGMVSSYFYSRTMGYIFYFGAMQSPYQGMAGLRIALTHLSNELGNGIIMYEVMKMLQLFFSVISSTIFAVGFALRMIPFTRKAGGMVIAIGFAAAVLYPYALYLSTLIHDQVILESAGGGVKIHHQITPADLDKITLELPDFLVELCTNDFIRIFTSLNEFGFWLLFCIPYCLIMSTVQVLIPCLPGCTGPQAPACIAGCIYLAYVSYFFTVCMPPYEGSCWPIAYNIYNGVQTAFTLASTVAMVAASKQIEGAVGGNPGEIYDTVMQKLVMPVSAASALPLMESVFVGIIVIVGARSLSAMFGGEVQIAGLGRLV